MALTMWFPDDIERLLYAIQQAHGDTVQNSKQPPSDDYRRGYADALRAVFAAFGMNYCEPPA